MERTPQVMAGHWTDRFSFATGAIRYSDLAYLVLSDDSASKRKIPMNGIVQWEPEGWGDGGTLAWRVAGVAVVRQPLEQLCVVGELGEVLMLGSGDRHEERIGKGKSSPKQRGPLRGVRAIGEHVYCVGMDRQAYRREAVGKWAAITKGLPPGVDEEIVGLEAIDGFSESDIYAVGWEGEVWHYDGDQWRRCNSPVDTVLVDVCCAEDGSVYACGRNGVLIKGRNEAWSVLDVGGFQQDVWSLASYAGAIYLATVDQVLTLEMGRVEVVHMGEDRARTCRELVVGQGLLWSIGAKDVMSFDGRTWTRID